MNRNEWVLYIRSNHEYFDNNGQQIIWIEGLITVAAWWKKKPKRTKESETIDSGSTQSNYKEYSLIRLLSELKAAFHINSISLPFFSLFCCVCTFFLFVVVERRDSIRLIEIQSEKTHRFSIAFFLSFILFLDHSVCVCVCWRLCGALNESKIERKKKHQMKMCSVANSTMVKPIDTYNINMYVTVGRVQYFGFSCI